MTGRETHKPRAKAIARKLKAEKEPLAAVFAQQLLDDIAPEDMVQYDDGQLVDFALDALKAMAKRRPGRSLVHIEVPKAASGGPTVVLIVNDDMPFLFDSVLGLLTERGHDVRLVAHPVMSIQRANDGKLKDVAAERSDADGFIRESVMYLHIEPLSEDVAGELKEAIEALLADVRIAVLDWRSMLKRVEAAMGEYQINPPPVPVEELTEVLAFLQWLTENHFTFLGVREYAFTGGADTGQLEPVEGSGLGILRNPDTHVLRRGRQLVTMTPAIRDFLKQPAPLIITKSDVIANVHRRVPMDYIGIKRFDAEGDLVGELRCVGLFTSTAYTRSPREIPMLRRKIATVLDKSGLNPSSHSGKGLLNVLETFPRDELFQIDVEKLGGIARGILKLDERPGPRVFARRDRFDRFVSALVYVPRDRFDSDVRRKIGELLASAYDGKVSSFAPSFGEGSLVRIHFIIDRSTNPPVEPDMAALNAAVANIVRTWDDRLADAVREAFDDATAGDINRRYRGAFPPGYIDVFPPEASLYDIREIEDLDTGRGIGGVFYRARKDPSNGCRIKLYQFDRAIPLSARLPVLENMGLSAIEESTFTASPQFGDERRTVFIHEVQLLSSDGSDIDIDAVALDLEACFLAVWAREAENDGFNALVLKPGFTWREAALLRACAKYLRQAGIAYSADYMAATLVKYHDIAAKLVEMFMVRFDPHGHDGKKGELTKAARKPIVSRLAREINDALQAVPSLDEDLIVRRYLNLIRSIYRTNLFQRDDDGESPPTIAFKINSRDIEELPAPRPFAEIFVYAPDFEGVHLRGGLIARGGLRWSDRPEDFRTEVLGLAKAQNVKNAVIVPVGAKGGFVPKRLPEGGSREEVFAEGTRVYKLFVSSLLSITDNLDGDKIIPPKDVVRNDGDDPYLVVAADKGTATFSDTANAISQAHHFWLDDAFASGGSAGYDHKKMGITARGAWEAVKRHFREMDVNIQTTPFTVIGVGDMSGDVFGNGMLLSEQIRLLAAFDHRDIFIDPDPDPAKSYAERKRMFDLPRSSWKDYDEKLISKGGGVFSRQLKAIELSDEMRALTGLSAKTATPNELIGAILRIDADLLWFGGIGTYIRASSESNAEAGDRANDAIRITAKELRVKVIGEGANLGVTQKGRIEFAEAGGRINTDAVDNSAGVNSSDIEVNIKIALGAAEKAGRLTRKKRNELLASMTDEVAALVLRNNYLQTLCLSLSQCRGARENGHMKRLMAALEKVGILDRALESLPDDGELSERDTDGQGLTRPELAVLMAYSKIELFDQLLASDVPDDPYFSGLLGRYFPARMQKPYSAEIDGHKLRREIIATQLSNIVINRGGSTFVSRLSDETGHGPAMIVRAFAVARDAFGLSELNERIDGLDNRIGGGEQLELYLEPQRMVRRATIWFLRNETLTGAIGDLVKEYRKGVKAVDGVLEEVLPEQALDIYRSRVGAYEANGVPRDLAVDVVRLRFLQRALDITRIAARARQPVKQVASLFFVSAEELGFEQLIGHAARSDMPGYYDRLAINRTIDGLIQTHRQIVGGIVTEGKDWATWSADNAAVIERIRTGLGDLLRDRDMTLAKLTVAASQLADLAPD